MSATQLGRRGGTRRYRTLLAEPAFARSIAAKKGNDCAISTCPHALLPSCANQSLHTEPTQSTLPFQFCEIHRMARGLLFQPECTFRPGNPGQGYLPGR